MIKTIIFDFGDVFMDLDKQATPAALLKLGLVWDDEWKKVDNQLEIGAITNEAFFEKLEDTLLNASAIDILKAWNAVMVGFPVHRLDFLKKLSKDYQLFLLSNTDLIHFEGFEKMVGKPFADEFYDCFTKCYFSYHLKVKKPDTGGFKTIISEHHLNVSETLFVDDNANNTAAAESLGMHTWTLQKGQQDVTELFEQGLPF